MCCVRCHCKCVRTLQAGAAADERAALGLLPRCEDYALLRTSGCTTNASWGDDAQEYHVMRSAMSRIGLDSAAQRDAVSILAAVLHLGNSGFKQDGNDEYVVVSDEAQMMRCSALLGCEDISPLMLQRTMKVSVTWVPRGCHVGVARVSHARYRASCGHYGHL